MTRLLAVSLTFILMAKDKTEYDDEDEKGEVEAKDDDEGKGSKEKEDEESTWKEMICYEDDSNRSKVSKSAQSNDTTSNLDKYLDRTQESFAKEQSFQIRDQVSIMSGRRTQEVIPSHPVVADLLAKIKADTRDATALDTAQVLFQTALIDSGCDIADPSALVNRVYHLKSKELGFDPDAPLKEVEMPRNPPYDWQYASSHDGSNSACRVPPT